jgi:regulator of nonsense transcripts 2
MHGLKLEKYLSEIATSISESKPKNTADLFAVVQVISLLHQRFPDFSDVLIPLFKSQLDAPPTYPATTSTEQKEREENARISKQRNAFRFLTELFLVGIINASNPKHKTFLFPDLIHLLVPHLTILNLSSLLTRNS